MLATNNPDGTDCNTSLGAHGSCLLLSVKYFNGARVFLFIRIPLEDHVAYTWKKYFVKPLGTDNEIFTKWLTITQEENWVISEKERKRMQASEMA